MLSTFDLKETSSQDDYENCDLDGFFNFLKLYSVSESFYPYRNPQ